jgi:hypothetical protein
VTVSCPFVIPPAAFYNVYFILNGTDGIYRKQFIYYMIDFY